MKALLWFVLAWSAWAPIATMVAGTSGEVAALTTVRSVGVGSASHCDSWHAWRERWSGLGSLGRHGLSQPLRWR
jgi:hypothetical protein